MKQFLIHIVCLCMYIVSYGQEEFHVFPKDHNETPGTQNGTGTINNPWDLQTALSQKPDIVNSGDTIWLHQGIYNGRFISTLQSLKSNTFITVSGFKKEKIILNGNVNSSNKNVLEVKGKQVIFKNFEITCLGYFSRNAKDEDFEVITGLEHSSGEDCQFINLKIHNNPGLGVGSWKQTGGSLFDGCVISNNGYIARDGRGISEGMYTQNISSKTRIIQNCIIFNNYYKGVEVWSANKKAKYEYVKNYEIKNNVIFNNGNPAQQFKDNLIIASGDLNGINIAKNVKVESNFFYHNSDIKNGQIGGDAASLTIGFNKNAPVENVTITGNVIIGRNNALRILHAKSLTFENNRIYSGYVTLNASVLEHINHWNFKNNIYFTKKSASFRVAGDKDYNLERWQSNFGIDQSSIWQHIKEFDMPSVVNVTKYQHRDLTYKVVLFQKDGLDVLVDFSKPALKEGLSYRIYDVENSNVILQTGTLSEDRKITFPMQLSAFEKPLHNTTAQKTPSNFGVFVIEFNAQRSTPVSDEKDNIFKRFFKWLGF
ncbi:right-handed parallel beta-helix repeat-containing protein [Psychroserpens ponticola]|uniref:Right-handed parallel beta-helix repeat-containing protein n=1 Tax=Psychroserpens ponticola TaxID=2932268 RepID=A0ABY7RYQ1_9FLAO|nr:right-handed parallel beta-helix repeat-containing protein [Psychroserpens ponticola]WCO00825.1 right-handed parallel beta-helix repeat-containing protein [Psychroserpens ponticola]